MGHGGASEPGELHYILPDTLGNLVLAEPSQTIWSRQFDVVVVVVPLAIARRHYRCVHDSDARVNEKVRLALVNAAPLVGDAVRVVAMADDEERQRLVSALLILQGEEGTVRWPAFLRASSSVAPPTHHAQLTPSRGFCASCPGASVSRLADLSTPPTY